MIYLLRWIPYIYKLSCQNDFQRKTNTESHDLEILWKMSSYGFQLSRRLNGRSTVLVGGLL